MKRLVPQAQAPVAVWAEPRARSVPATDLDLQISEQIEALLEWRTVRHDHMVNRLLGLASLGVIGALGILAFTPLPELALAPAVFALACIAPLVNLRTRHRLRRSTARWVDGVGRVLAPPSRAQRNLEASLTALLPGLRTTAALPGLIRLTESLERSLNHDERALGKAAAATVVRLLPLLTLPTPVLGEPRVRGFLRTKIRVGLQIQQGASDNAFDISLHRAPRAGSVYDWDFVVNALLLLGEAGDSQIRPLAELLARRHPYERIRTAADACLRTLNRKEA